jgi:hypothetical protein
MHIEDMLIDEAAFKKVSGLFSRLMPANQPVYVLTGMFIQQGIQAEINPLLIGER